MAEEILTRRTLWELSDDLEAGRLSPVELVQAYLDRLDRLEGVIHSHITVCHEEAVAAARVAEAEIRSGRRRGRLHGLPFSVKDNIWSKGVRTTAHSESLREFVPEADATVIARLKEAGAILLGKTNTNEYACGLMDLFGETANPWDTRCSTVGSSTGSAAAAAAGLTAAAIGTDTGGSTRVPSAFCGVVGMIATYGRVSRFGVIPLSWTMDYAGPITRTVADAALMLQAIAGHDPLDPSTAPVPVPGFTAALGRSPRGLVVGVPEQHFYERIHPEILAAVQAGLRQLEALGLTLKPVSLPMADDLAAIQNLIIMAEAFPPHAERLRQNAQLYGDKPRRRIASGAFCSAADYLLAEQLRRRWVMQLEAAMQEVDLLVVPTLPMVAMPLAEWRVAPPDTSYNTRPFNLSGNPALTLPCGFTQHGMPIGMQLVGRRWGEETLFTVGHAYQQVTDWHTRTPPCAPGSYELPVPTPAVVPPVDPAEMARLRAEAAYHGLALTEADLAVVANHLRVARAGIEQLRHLRTDWMEPLVRFPAVKP